MNISHAIVASNNNGIEQREILRVVYGIARPMCASARRLVLCVKTRTTRALNATPSRPRRS